MRTSISITGCLCFSIGSAYAQEDWMRTAAPIYMTPSVIRIIADSTEPACKDVGSGVIVGAGHVLTAKHVVMKDGCQASIYGRAGSQEWQLDYIDSSGDVAILAVNSNTPIDFTIPLAEGISLCSARLSRNDMLFGESNLLSIPDGFDRASPRFVRLNGLNGGTLVATGDYPSPSESGGAAVVGGYVVGTIEGFFENRVIKIQPISRFWSLANEHGLSPDDSSVCDMFLWREKLASISVEFVGGIRVSANQSGIRQEFRDLFEVTAEVNAAVASAYGLNPDEVEIVRQSAVDLAVSNLSAADIPTQFSDGELNAGSGRWLPIVKFGTSTASVKSALKALKAFE